MRSIDEILNKIKEIKGIKTDTDLAKLFGLKPNAVTNWRKRGTIPYEHLVSLCEKERLSLMWLLTGQVPTKYIDVEGTRVLTTAEEPGIYKQGQGEGQKLDADLMGDILAMIEDILEEQELTLEKRKKGRIAAMIYNHIIAGGEKKPEEIKGRILELVRIAA
jgi:hypothetical protein